MNWLLDALSKQGGNPNLQDLQDLGVIDPAAGPEALKTMAAVTLGVPMDMAYLGQQGYNALMPEVLQTRALKDYSDTVGTSDWWAQKFGVDINSPAYLATALATPLGGGKAQKAQRAVSKAKKAIERSLKVSDVKHGKPVTFTYGRNTNSAPDMGARFGQDIEPSGRYMQSIGMKERSDIPGMEYGEHTFERPMVIWSKEGYGKAGNWKNRLSEMYGGLKGEKLSKAVRADGYDGIITIDKTGKSPHVSEMVDLQHLKGPKEPEFKARKAFYAKEFQPQSLHSVKGEGKMSRPGAVKSFIGAQKAAREKMSPDLRAQVDELPADYKGTVYMTPEKDAGFAISQDGYVSHLWKDPDSKRSGAIEAVLTKARAEGAKDLHAFDTYLVDKYAKTGAVEKSRVPWNPKYADETTKAGLGDKQPDYVGMDVAGVFKEKRFPDLLEARVEQEPLDRRFFTPAGRQVVEPPTVEGMFTPERIDELKKYADAGMAKDAHKYYWQGGVADEFIKRLGPEKGLKEFQEMGSLSAALSGMSNVPAELKRMSVLRNRLKRGLPIKNLSHEMFPPGYGHTATETTHAPAINRWLETGSVADPHLQPKYAAYEAALQGNLRPSTIDRHYRRALVGGEDMSNPTITEYPFIEQRLDDVAMDYGLLPGEFQSSVWVGAADKTGVADPTNRTQAFNQRIAKTAEERGITEEEMLDDFIYNGALLKMLLAGIGAPLAAGAMMPGRVEDS